MRENIINTPSAVHTPENPENWWHKYTPPLSYESPAKYMFRLGNQVNEQVYPADKEKVGKKINRDNFKEEMFNGALLMLNKPRALMPEKELLLEMDSLEKRIHSVKNELSNPRDKIRYFRKTVSDRPLYGKIYGRRSINDIFAIPYPHESEKVKSIFEQRINGKNILVLGGGNSMMDLLTSKKYTPKAVINVDPYLQKESLKKNSRGFYQSVPLKAESDELVRELKERSIEKVDEIWASYSVPFYLETKEAIRSLFKNVHQLLAKNGVLRIYPLVLADFTNESKKAFDSTEPYDERKQAFIEAVQELIDTGEYNLDVFSRGLHLEKMT